MQADKKSLRKPPQVICANRYLQAEDSVQVDNEVNLNGIIKNKKMRKLNLTIVVVLFLASCNNGVKQSEYDKLQAELTECKKTVEELQNTPQVRLTNGQQYLANNDFDNAKRELNTLIEKFGGTDEAKKAQSLVKEIEKQEKAKKEAEERKKALGFKVLKETNSVKVEPVTLNFSSVTSNNKWTFENDKYGYYRYLTAEREKIYILAKVSITSEAKETKIPLISVYELSGGSLNLLGVMKRQFVNDPNNNYSNVDFKYVSTVALSHALEIPSEKLKNNAIFVVVKRNNCSRFETGYYLDTELERTITKDNNQCGIKSTLTVDDFDNEYVLVKILNKEKL